MMKKFLGLKYLHLKKKWMVVLGVCVLGLTGCAATKEYTSETESQSKTQQEVQTEASSEIPGEIPTEMKEEPPTETESQIPEPVVQTVKITAVGDCTLGVTQTHGYAGSFHEYYDSYGEDYFFSGVREIFERDDFTLINLECVLSDSNERIEKDWNLKGKPSYVGIMTNSSVEGCSLGNNHTRDYGESGLNETIQVLNDAGIVYGLNEHVATYTTESGIVVGIVSSNLLWRDEVHINYVKDGITALREMGADLILVSCHWGTEGEHYATDYQKNYAHQIIDWGADVIIGTHPHVLQGIELYNGKLICYSLGNFCFGGNRNPADKNTVVFEQTFTFVDGVLQGDVNAGIVPCTLSSTSTRNDFCPTIAEGEKRTQILTNMNAYSKDYSKICFDENGKLMLVEE